MYNIFLRCQNRDGGRESISAHLIPPEWSAQSCSPRTASEVNKQRKGSDKSVSLWKHSFLAVRKRRVTVPLVPYFSSHLNVSLKAIDSKRTTSTSVQRSSLHWRWTTKEEAPWNKYLSCQLAHSDRQVEGITLCCIRGGNNCWLCIDFLLLLWLSGTWAKDIDMKDRVNQQQKS